jgi:hypothetical protein
MLIPKTLPKADEEWVQKKIKPGGSLAMEIGISSNDNS